MIGTYRILQEIGHGGMGTVYLGEHVLLGRRAAIKVLKPTLAGDAVVLKRFFNEARAVTRIADPGIVQVFDFGHDTKGHAYIVMELLDGEAMDKRLKRIGTFGVLECLRLMRLICTSLGAAHAKGIVHRDLKPENIFIVADPAVPGGERAKILDFGIAKLANDEPGQLKTRTDVLIGTPSYMSPEQCRGGASVDHRSDIYTIGCVMFAMLTGKPPFAGESGELISAHLRELPPLASSRVAGLPDSVDQLLDRCLRKSPGERYQSMAELVQAVATIEHAVYRAATGDHGGVETLSELPASGPVVLPTLALAPAAPPRTPTAATVILPRLADELDRPRRLAQDRPSSTLNDANGQASTPQLYKSRSPMRVMGWSPWVWRLGAVAAMLVAGGGVAMVTLRGAGTSSLAAQPVASEAVPEPDPASASPPAAAPTPAATIDAGVPADAGMPEPPTAHVAPAATVHPAKPAGKATRPPRTEREHASSTDSALDPDRGD